MRRRICKLSRARMVALAVSVGAFGSLATAQASFAAGAGPKPPAVGTSCQPDGKINGGGSTFQPNAVNNAFTWGYQQDLCGPQPNVANLNSTWGTTDPSIFTFTVGTTNNSVQGMVAYNYSLGGTALSNGSGNGLRRLSCRTDMFAGTDLPYNNTQLGTPGNGTVAGLDGPPGSESGGTAPQYDCDNGTLNTTAVPPPFGPQPSAGPWPATGDAAANAMSFPIAGGAVAYAVNLNGMCTNGTPTGLNLTQSEFQAIWEGTINQWNDAALVATNPSLGTDNCSGPITRVVRQDNSGTTAITEFTLSRINPNNLCGTDAANNWYALATASSNAQTEPDALTGSSPNCVDSNGNPATNFIFPTTSGSPAVISLTESTNGSIGYGELGLWGPPASLPAGVSFVNLQNSTGTAFVSPGCGGRQVQLRPPDAAPDGSHRQPGGRTRNSDVEQHRHRRRAWCPGHRGRRNRLSGVRAHVRPGVYGPERGRRGCRGRRDRGLHRKRDHHRGLPDRRRFGGRRDQRSAADDVLVLHVHVLAARAEHRRFVDGVSERADTRPVARRVATTPGIGVPEQLLEPIPQSDAPAPPPGGAGRPAEHES